MHIGSYPSACPRPSGLGTCPQQEEQGPRPIGPLPHGLARRVWLAGDSHDASVPGGPTDPAHCGQSGQSLSLLEKGLF